MNKCRECNCTIYESRRYRELKETLVILDKRFENVVNDLCQHCLEQEQTKYIRNKVLNKVLNKVFEGGRNARNN